MAGKHGPQHDPDAARQLLDCLVQLAGSSSGADGEDAGSTDKSVGAVRALLQVRTFASLVAAAAPAAYVTEDGQLQLRVAAADADGRTTAAAAAAPPSDLLAAVIAAAAERDGGPDCQAAADVLLLQLMPQLLSCRAAALGARKSHGRRNAASGSSSGQAWAAILGRGASQLFLRCHEAAAELPAAAVAQLEQVLGQSGRATQLCLGEAACVDLLAQLLEPTAPSGAACGGAPACQLPPQLLQRLLACAIPALASDGQVQQQVQGRLVPGLMAAAAAAAAADAAEPPGQAHASSSYAAACEQLLLAVCCVSPGPGMEQQAPAAAAGAWSSGRVSQALALACRLQPHVLEACRPAGACQQLLHELLLQGLLHGDPQCRQRAAHLVEACVAAGCAPQVFDREGWAAFLLLYRAEEQHMLHLISPLWTEHFHQLWAQASSFQEQRTQERLAGEEDGQQQQQQQQHGEAALRVRWCSVLVLRTACHSNVGVRRLGLTGLLGLQPSTLQALVSGGAWPALHRVLLQLLPVFDRKLVSAADGGSATARQAQAVQALQQQLTSFLSTCQQLLLQQAQQQAQQQQEQQQEQPVRDFVRAFVDQAMAAGDRAHTALFLLRALAAAGGSSNEGGSSGSSNGGNGGNGGSGGSGSSGLLQALTRAMGGVDSLHPGHLRPAVRAQLLQLAVTHWRPGEGSAAAAAMGLLSSGSSCSSMVGPAAAGAADGDGGLAPEVAQAVQQQRAVFGAEFLQLLQDALWRAKKAAAAAVESGEKQAGAGQCWLAGLLGAADATALCTLGLLAPDMHPDMQLEFSEQVLLSMQQQQQQQQQQQHREPPAALAWLLSGLTAGLATHTASGKLSMSAGAPAPVVEALAACVVKAVPMLLAQHQAGGSSYDDAWCQAVVALAGLAAALPALQPALLEQLQGWLPALEPTLAAAAGPAASLDQQLLLLASALVPGLLLRLGRAAACRGSQAGAPADLTVCLQHLAALQPARDASAEFSSGAALAKAELVDRLGAWHACLTHQLVAAAGPQLPPLVKQQLFARCLSELEWVADVSLQPLLGVLQVVAPWDQLQRSPQQQQQQQQDDDASAGATDQLQALLRLLPPLVRGRRLMVAQATQLVQAFFNPGLFADSRLRCCLDTVAIPFALSQGGVRLSVALTSHLCGAVLAPSPALLHAYLPHLAHVAAFSLFQERVSQAEALQQQQSDVSVRLPSRVVLCAFLVQLARSGQHAAFTTGLTQRLLDIAQAAAPQYAWLAGREAGQSSAANAIKVAVWQALCLLAPHLPDAQLDEALQQGWACLLNSHQHPNTRQHVQLFTLALIRRQPAATSRLLLPVLDDYAATSSYQVAVSCLILGMFILLELGPNSDLFTPLLQALFPWALHHRHAVRVPVQVMLHVVFSRHMAAIEQAFGANDTQLLQQVRSFLSRNEEAAKLRERQALVDLEGFCLARETSLEGVFGVREDQLASLCDGEADSTGLLWPLHVRDRLPLDLLACLPGAVKAVGRRRTQPAAGGAGGRGGGGGGPAPAAGEDAGEAPSEAGAEEGSSLAGSMHQFRPQIQGSLFDDAAADKAEALAASRACRPGLVLCASLLDNVPNLAGLSRTCESLSAEALVVPSRAVVATDAFLKQSRTSEQWLRIMEVGQADVATFLAERRAAGYTIIGVEQATNSVALQDYTFPRRCVVLLGNEQNGMPAPLLAHLDVCVEIPMLGVTRSLNAHVSGAMVLWQYTQQQLAQGRQQ